ncbi:MAG: LapA family protein [Deltaproteobacteria bacterium]|nr:MAG: LapA family protein [Deltaproteobacteria bacterium]
MRVPLVVVILVALVVGIFAFQNQEIVTVKFLNTAWMTSKSYVIIGSVVAGFVAGILVMLPGTFKRWRKAKGLEKEVGTLRRELETIRKTAQEASSRDGEEE